MDGPLIPAGGVEQELVVVCPLFVKSRAGPMFTYRRCLVRRLLYLVILLPFAVMAAGRVDYVRVQNAPAVEEVGLQFTPAPAFGRASGGTDIAGRLDTIGGTTYDLQANGPTAPRIAYDPSYGIHVVWTYSADAGGSFPGRYTRYNFFNESGVPPSWVFNPGPNFMNRGANVLTARSGFGNLDVNPSSHCVYVGCHQGDSCRATVLRQTSPGGGTFQEGAGPNNLPWPVISLSSTQRVHVAATLDQGINNRTKMYYARIDPWSTWSTPAAHYGTAPFPGFPNYGLAAGKHSQKVAVVWSVTMPPREVGYIRTSADDGATWSAAAQLTFPSTFHPGSETIPSFSVGSLYPFYDSRDTLHIVAAINPVCCRGADTFAYVMPAEIWHWSVATGWTRVCRSGCDSAHIAGAVGYNAVYAARPTIGQGGASEFVCVWEEFDSTNVEPATGQLRADIFGARSTDFGANWGTKTRLTDPDQSSKRFPCIADRMKGDSCLITYLVDLIAGSAVLGQGDASNNPVVVQRLPKTSLFVPAGGPDVAAAVVLAPAGTLTYGSTVTLACSVYNNGNTTATYTVRMRVGAGYDSGAVVTAHAPGTYRFVTFPTWTASPAGGHSVVAFTTLGGDIDRRNDTASGGCTVLPASTPGWSARASYPAGAKYVKEGAWLAFDAGAARIYAARGCKTSDFYEYNPAADSWKRLLFWPSGTEGKPPSKGAAGCASGTGTVFATKGNNTQGFWKYDAGTDAWTQKQDVPLGPTKKKVKGGTDLVWALRSGIGYPYLLKGYKNEFWRYHVTGDSWRQMRDAPVGAKEKWDKGSWLAYDGDHTIFAHKAKYHEFYSYDVNTDTWSRALTGMPFLGSGGTKKSKDGGCGAFLGATVYALKGGNTQEFWCYSVAGKSWAELESMPRGLSGKKVKAGADIVAVGAANVLYALKGNKTNELWRYTPGRYLLEAPGRDGAMAGGSPNVEVRMSISPSPLTGGFATVRLEGPVRRPVRLDVYDVTGRIVSSFITHRSSFIIPARLPAGVYILRLGCAEGALSRKLVVE